jgi:formylglycine-generating enzyme required for sulfatase activity
VLVFAGAVQAQSLLQTFGSGANQFSISFVTIGNPGNAAMSRLNPYPDRLPGAVSYIYNIGKYEISRDMIAKANSAGSLGITMWNMTSFGGNGVNRPATGISWNEAARFVNYLNTSKGYQAAYNFTTSGANDNISLWGAGQHSGDNKFRHKDAYYFLPSEDEWFKAAYGSPSGTWYKYSTGSDSIPMPVSGGTTSGTVVYNNQSSPADITNAGGLSPYGTMAQGGNAWEWMESDTSYPNDAAGGLRILRGGSWDRESEIAMRIDADRYANADPAQETFYNPDPNGPSPSTFGFRVASVPEPSALSLLALGLGGWAIFRRQQK